MPNNTLDRLEAIARRRLLAATTPKERCVRALALMAIQAQQKRTSSGEEATASAGRPTPANVAPSPVGVPNRPPTPPLFSDTRPDVARAGYHSLDPMPCPPEKPVSVGSAATPARRAGQRA